MHLEQAVSRINRTRRPPLVEPIKSPPEWADKRGESLVRLTREQAAVGIDDPQFRGKGPLTVLTGWFGPGDSLTKPALEPSMDGYDPMRVRVFRPSHGQRRLRIDQGVAQGSSVTISYTLDGVRVLTKDLGGFDHSLLRKVLPMRDFARRLQQKNKPVAPWLHTVGHHVGAESHHERTLMMLADYHSAIDHISGQPFTLVWPKDSELDSHTPDVCLLSGEETPLIVDVRTPEGAVDPEWAAKVPTIRRAIESLGMGYVVWTGMSRPYRRNLENFTEARVPPESYENWSLVALALCADRMTAGDLADSLDASGYRRPHALTLIRRMLWRRSLRTDMFTLYSTSSIVERADGQE